MSFLWSFAAAQRPKDPEAGSTAPTPPGDMKPMNIAFKKGVHYNMKIIIRGDVMTGKTALFNRLQGSAFDPEYTATPQIQVANIQWNYNDTNDIIKVEIWDVVDKGVSNVTSKSDAVIKLEHNPTTPTTAAPPSISNTDRQLASQEIALDATNINVYRNTHGVIFLFDITKSWTFEYVVRELDNVPANMSVLVLGNFSDQSVKRAVDLGHIQQTLSEHNQRRLHEKNVTKANLVRYVESSMLNGYGLKFIHRYLGVPFLELQTDTLRQQLELKTQELVTLLSDLDTSEEVPKGLKRRKASALPQEETRLDKQHSQMQTLWDGEGEVEVEGRKSVDFQSSSPSPAIVALPSINRENSPAPPTSPVRAPRLTSAPPAIASAHTHVPDFDAGELEDDFFTEDVGAIKTVNHDRATALAPIPPLQDSDDEWGGATGGGFNPMVTVDEDVEGVDYVDDEDDVPQQPTSVSQLASSFPSFRTAEVPAPVRNVWDIPAVQDTDDSDYDSDAFAVSSVVVPVGDVTTRVTQLMPSEVKPVVAPQSRDATGEFGFGGVEFEGFRTGARGYEEIGGGTGGSGGRRGRAGSGGSSNPWAERGILARQEAVDDFYNDDAPTYQSYTSPPSLRSYPTSPTSPAAAGSTSPWGAPLGGHVVSSPDLYASIGGSDHESGEKKKKARKKEKENVESEAKEGKEKVRKKKDGVEKEGKKKDGVEKEKKKKSSKAKSLKTGYEDF